MTRAEKYAEIKRLREDDGLLWREIGERLGLSRSMAHDIYSDPTGEKARERRHRRHGTCVDCGAKTFNGGSVEVPARCRECYETFTKTDLGYRRHRAAQHVGRVHWSDDEIFAAIRSIAVDGIASIDAYCAAYEDAPRDSMPSPSLVAQHRFGTWTRAVELAGLRTAASRSGPYSSRITEAECRLAVNACMSELGRLPSHSEYEEWAKADPARPSVTLVRLRVGGWRSLLGRAA